MESVAPRRSRPATRAAAPPSGPASRLARPLFPALVLITVLALLAPGAAAHADLIGAEPPPNSQLDEAPRELLLSFSEPFDDSYNSREDRHYSHVHVMDDGHRRYDQDNIFEKGDTRIRVPLDEMPDGLYTVHWQTLGTDTHVLRGQYLLAVNVTFDEAYVPPRQGGPSEAPEEHFGTEVAIRTVGFLAASLAAGIPLFVLVLPRGDPLEAGRRAHHGTTGIAALAATGTGLLLLLLIGQRIDGTLLDAARTSGGTWILIRSGAFILVAVTALTTTRWPGRMRSDDAAAAFFGVLGLAATTMAGHAAAEETLRTLAIVVDLLHLVAVAFWLGGIVLLMLLIVRHIEPQTLYLAVKRFSPLAVAAVGVIILTGLVTSGLRIVTLDDLVTTIYGRALSLKVLLLVPLIGLGAFNRYFIQPRLTRREPARAVRHLRLSVLGEVLVMVVVLVAAATLATVAPPDTLSDRDDGPAFVGPPPGHLRTFQAEGMEFVVTALPDPLTVGRQNITVTVERLEDDAPPLRSMLLIVRPPDEGPTGEGEVHRLTEGPEGTWYVHDFLMTSPGTWHNDLFVQFRGAPQHDEHLPMDVS